MRFYKGQKVKIIKAHPTSSTGVHEHQDEIVTIKRFIPWCGGYEVEEIPDTMFTAGCFENINKEV